MITRCRVAAVLILLMATGVARADETFEELSGEFKAAQQAWYEQMQKMEQDGSFDPSSMPEQPQAAFAPRFRAYAEAHAGTPDAVPALQWLLQNPSFGPMGPDLEPAKWASAQLAEHHAADPGMGEVMQGLQYASWMLGREPVIELCEKVLAVNEDENTRAAATFTLAVTLYSEMIEGPGRDVERAETLFRSIGEEFGDTPFASQAEAYIFELDHLQVGMKAPEIVGTNLDGEDVKLSQFEGQVVVLDFWGFW
jgi:hypothetical protein